MAAGRAVVDGSCPGPVTLDVIRWFGSATIRTADASVEGYRMRRRSILRSLVASLGVVLTVGACQRDTTRPNAAALSKEPFFISGAITEAGHPWGYRVKGEPGTSYGVTEAYFKLVPNTAVQRADGTPATAADLTVGRAISLWITGPIAESFPVQVTAQLIVLK